MCDAEFKYEPFWNSVKRESGSQLDNCEIFDDTFGKTVASGFSLTLGQAAGPFFANFPIDSKVTNEATLTCDDQFDITHTATATAMYDVYDPSVLITKDVKAKVELGEAPQYNIRITNTSPDGKSVLTDCEIKDDGLVPPLLVEGITLQPGASFPPAGEDALMPFGPVLDTTEPFTNTVTVACHDQQDENVEHSAIDTVTPVEFSVFIDKECDEKAVIEDLDNPPQIECTIDV